MKKEYFGTDGIRGTVGQGVITPDFILKLAHAVGQVLQDQLHKSNPKNTKRPVVLIGKDTRLSGYMLESALESGFNSAGVDVVLLGPIPTPAVAYLTRAQRADLGVVISASHNPFADNGIKFFSAQGTKLGDEWEFAVEAALQKPPKWAQAAHLGRAQRLQDASGRYIEFCKSTFPNDMTLKGLKIVVDGAHGAAYQIAPKVFHELGAEVIAIGCQPDGLNINLNVGATHPNALVAAVLANGADCGIALDGDADRLQWVDSAGRLLDGDELLYIVTLARLEQGESIQGVVGTLMTNAGIEEALNQRGIELIRAQVGDRYVLEELTQRRWLLGGESSGHLLVLDKHSTGDGIVSALQVLQALLQSKKSTSEWLDGVQMWTQVLINVRLKAGQTWTQKTEFAPRLSAITKEIEDELKHKHTGRVLIRPSGTEPLVRVMVEAKDTHQANFFAQRIANCFVD